MGDDNTTVLEDTDVPICHTAKVTAPDNLRRFRFIASNAAEAIRRKSYDPLSIRLDHGRVAARVRWRSIPSREGGAIPLPMRRYRRYGIAKLCRAELGGHGERDRR